MQSEHLVSSLSVLSLRLVGDIVINETPHKVLCSSTYHSPTQLVSQNKETATQSKCKSYFGFKYIYIVYTCVFAIIKNKHRGLMI